MCAARQGLAVLLLDRQVPPRSKPCGCCLNPAALQALSTLGLSQRFESLGPTLLTDFRLGDGRTRLTLEMSGATVPREMFDEMLVQEAIAHGATFLAPVVVCETGLRTNARCVSVRNETTTVEIAASVVVAASGLGSNWLNSETELADRFVSSLRLGISTSFDATESQPSTGTICMGINADGYAGVVRQGPKRIHVAACLRQDALRQTRAGTVVAGLIGNVGLAFTELSAAKWQGTPRLTHGRPAAGRRIILVGDAASYTEPFTGEGIAWALLSAIAAAPFVADAAEAWNDEISGAWARQYRKHIQHRQVFSMLLCKALRFNTCRKILFMLARSRLLTSHVLKRMTHDFLSGV
jgi:menaquinone-9 beta-reductase